MRDHIRGTTEREGAGTMTEQVKTAGVAIASLVCGIAGLMCFGPLGAIPAVICGHKAMSRIKASGGTLQGEGLALAGLIMGYVSIAFMVVMIPLIVAIAIPNFIRARETTQKNSCANNIRQFDAAKARYAIETGLAPGAEIIPSSALNAYLTDLTVDEECPAGGTYRNIPLVGTPVSCSTRGRPGAEADDDQPAPPQE
jgi:hypothetical protein